MVRILHGFCFRLRRILPDALKRRCGLTTYKIVVPIAFMNAHRKDAVMLLRIGAGVNAMEATLRLVLLLDDRDNRAATKLSRLQAPVAAVGYLREIVKMIEAEKYENRFWNLVDIAAQNGVDLGQDLEQARLLLSTSHPDIGGPTLLKVRDKIGFHWDPQPFQAFLNNPEITDVTIYETDGRKNIDRIFRASADAMEGYFLTIGGEGVQPETVFDPIVVAHGTIGKVLEAAWLGMIIDAGDDPRSFWVESEVESA